MTKLSFKILVSVVSLSLIFTGCTNSSASDDPSEVFQEIINEVKTDKAQNDKKQDSESTDNKEQRKLSNPDMFGKVKSIIGNEVVLELAEIPERQGKLGNGQSSDEKKAGGGQGTSGGNGGGMPPQGMKGGSRELKLTGETATLFIPVGIPITTFSQEGTKELDIADIYEGVTLQIWFDKDDKEAITNIRMTQGRG